MRRVTLWIVATIAGLVLLFSYRTSLGGGTAAAGGPVIVSPSAPGGDLTVTLRAPDSNGRDTEINGYALPQLRAEVLAAQSAHVDTVGGATYTSDGYRKSLQSALDAAHFA